MAAVSSLVRLRILAFGASLTEGYHSDGCLFHPYTDRLAQLFRSASKHVEIENAGVSGEAVLSPTMLPRLKQLLSSSAHQPFDWILLLAGTNDTIRDQEKASRVFDGYKLLIDECHRNRARVLAMTLPETEYPTASPMDRQRREFNRLIKEQLTPRKDVVVLDVDYHLPQHSLSDDQREQIWDDGIHLTPYGYDRLGELIYQALQPHLA